MTRYMVHLAAVGVLTYLQWALFSANALIGVIGLPILLIWGIPDFWRDVCDRTPPEPLLIWIIAAAISYIPMAATLLGIKLWLG